MAAERDPPAHLRALWDTPGRVKALSLSMPTLSTKSEPARPAAPTAMSVSSTKRARGPDDGPDNGGVSVKRQKPEFDAKTEIKMFAMLQNALGDLDSTQAQVRPSSSRTVTPQLEKPPGVSIMKASSSPAYMMRSMSLPVLGNLAVQILLRLSQQPRRETETLLADLGSEFKMAYDMLLDMFATARNIFSTGSALLSPDELEVADEDRETIRISNLASISAAVFGDKSIPLAAVHQNFLLTFMPEGSEYPDEATDLFVNLKTQVFLCALDQAGAGNLQPSIAETAEELFANIDKTLLQRHGDVALSADEERLVAEAKMRKDVLFRLMLEEQCSKEALAERLSYDTFKDDLSLFLENHLPVVVEYAEKCGINIPPRDEPLTSAEVTSDAKDGQAVAPLPGTANPAPDPKSLASFITETLSNGQLDGSNHPQDPGRNVHPMYLARLGMDPSNITYGQASAQSAAWVPTASLPPNQSSPTSELYEKARQAAVVKSSATTERRGLHSGRRPWSSEEEKALMMGLDMVKGPHWSQILNLFGSKGTLSNVLRDRSQVQLKDKARNLKLFFLKANSEMPFYLRSVTGDLKSRAPSQIAKKEAMAKAQMNSAEDQATVQGILTLANGLQHKPGQDLGPVPSPHANAAAATRSPMSAHRNPVASGPGGAAYGTMVAGTASPVAKSPRVKTEPIDQPSHIWPGSGPQLRQQPQQQQHYSSPSPVTHGYHQPLAPALPRKLLAPASASQTSARMRASQLSTSSLLIDPATADIKNHQRSEAQPLSSAKWSNDRPHSPSLVSEDAKLVETLRALVAASAEDYSSPLPQQQQQPADELGNSAIAAKGGAIHRNTMAMPGSEASAS